MKSIVLLSVTGLSCSLLSGCLFQQNVKVERWTDLEKPCQPHGFYIAPKGDSLSDVAQVCKIDESVLRKYNAWLLARQPFAESTVVWLKQNPAIKPGDESLMVEAIVPVSKGMMSSEILTPEK